MPDCGVHYLWFAFVCFLIRSHPPRPPPPPPPLPMFEADNQILLRRQEDLSLQFFGPPLAGTIGAPWEDGDPSQPPPPPSDPPSPPPHPPFKCIPGERPQVRNSVALCCDLHVRFGEEHPRTSRVMGVTECEASAPLAGQWAPRRPRGCTCEQWDAHASAPHTSAPGMAPQHAAPNSVGHQTNTVPRCSWEKGASRCCAHEHNVRSKSFFAPKRTYHITGGGGGGSCSP